MSKTGTMCLGFALALVCGSLSAATTHKVPGDFDTIALAVAGASTGDTISIGKNPASFDGAWYENVVVPAGVVLNFVGKAVWDGNVAGSQGDCLSFTGATAGVLTTIGLFDSAVLCVAV